MILAKQLKHTSVKVRMDGYDKDRKNTTRSMIVLDATVDEVEEVIREAIKKASDKHAPR
jgi:hypothetical protein